MVEIYDYEHGSKYGPMVTARIHSRYSPSSVYWWRDGAANYVLAHDPEGPWGYKGKRVALVSIHGTGEIRWSVRSTYAKQGQVEFMQDHDRDAMKHFGLRPFGEKPTLFNAKRNPVYSKEIFGTCAKCLHPEREHKSPPYPGGPTAFWTDVPCRKCGCRELMKGKRARMKNPMMNSRTSDLAAAKRAFKPLGITINVVAASRGYSHGRVEYRVNFAGGKEATAYYTDDLDDAVGTGHAMAAHRAKYGTNHRNPVEQIPGGGGTVITGKAIQLYRLLALKHAMKLELTTGMKMSRGISPFRIVKQELGLKGSKQKLFDQLCAYIEKVGPGLAQKNPHALVWQRERGVQDVMKVYDRRSHAEKAARALRRRGGLSGVATLRNAGTNSRCEDYPACGHGPAPYGDSGGCPDASGRFNCVMCGRKLAKTAPSSICAKCQKRMSHEDYDYPGGDPQDNPRRTKIYAVVWKGGDGLRVEATSMREAASMAQRARRAWGYPSDKINFVQIVARYGRNPKGFRPLTKNPRGRFDGIRYWNLRRWNSMLGRKEFIAKVRATYQEIRRHFPGAVLTRLDALVGEVVVTKKSQVRAPKVRK
jgi:hypothetical protein